MSTIKYHLLRHKNKKTSISRAIFLLCFFIFLFIIFPVLAANSDSTPPTKPSGLNAVVLESSGEQKILLTWNPSIDPLISGDETSGVFQYNILRNGFPLGGAAHPATSYLDEENIAVPTTYIYEITAIDNNNNHSQKSDPLTVIVNDIIKPSAPENLSAQILENLSIRLSWSQSTDNIGVIKYKIYRDNIFLETIGNLNEYTNTNLSPQTTYTYQVSALDSAGNESDKSQGIDATTGGFFNININVSAPGIADGIVESNPIAIKCGMGESDCVQSFQEGSTITLSANPDYFTSYFTGWAGHCSGNEPTCILENIDSNLTIQANFQIDNIPPTVPANLNASAVGTKQIQISINSPSIDNSGKVKGYEIYRNGTIIGETEEGIASFRDTGSGLANGLEAGNTYTYNAKAKDYRGNSSALSVPANAIASDDEMEIPPEILKMMMEEDDPQDSFLELKNWISEKYKWGIGLAGILAVFMILVGAFHLLTSGGNAGMVTQAKSYIGSALFGLILALSSYVILETINPNITNLITYKNIDLIQNLDSKCSWYGQKCEDLNFQDEDPSKCGLKAGGEIPGPDDHCCCPIKSGGINCCVWWNSATPDKKQCYNVDKPKHCQDEFQGQGITIKKEFKVGKACNSLYECPQGTVSEDTKQLAQEILDNPSILKNISGGCSSPSGVVSPVSNLTEVKNGQPMTACNSSCSSGVACTKKIAPDSKLLQAMVSVFNNEGIRYRITSIAGGKHGNNSYHYQGKAADFTDIPPFLGSSYQKEDWNRILNAFKKYGAAKCEYGGGLYNTCPNNYKDGLHIHFKVN